MPNFKDFQLQGYLNTESEVKRIARVMAADYLAAAQAVKKEMRSYYAKYLSGVSPDDYYDTLLQYNRLNNMLDEIERLYMDAAKKAGGDIAAASELAITNNFYRQRYALSFVDQPIDLQFGLINPNIVEASVYGTAEAWDRIRTEKVKEIYGNPNLYMRKGTLTELLMKNSTENLLQIRGTISSGLLTGESYTQTAKKIQQLIGTTYTENGVRKYTGALADAMRITRTESARTMNAGNLGSTNMARSEGLEVGRIWDATLDTSTRAAHAAADGRRENEEGLFSVGGEHLAYPGGGTIAGNNINCRCTTIDVVGDDTPQLRRGRNPVTGKNEVFTYKNYNEWMESNGMTQDKSGKWKPKKKDKKAMSKNQAILV